MIFVMFCFVSDGVCLYDCTNYWPGLCGEVGGGSEQAGGGKDSSRCVVSADKSPTEHVAPRLCSTAGELCAQPAFPAGSSAGQGPQERPAAQVTS